MTTIILSNEQVYYFVNNIIYLYLIPIYILKYSYYHDYWEVYIDPFRHIMRYYNFDCTFV